MGGEPSRRSRRTALVGLALTGLLVLGGFVHLYRLTVPSWLPDEVIYVEAGRAYVAGDHEGNREHPPLGKQILGVAQALFGEGLGTARATAAIATMITGVLLYLLGRSIGGRAVGLLALALWFLLPDPVSPGHSALVRVKMGRYGMLDVFMAAFMTAGLLAGWHWMRSGRWRWALLAGAGIGMAAAAKAPGILLLPIVVFAGVVGAHDRRRAALQIAALLGTCAVLALAPYAAFGGEADDAIRYMFEFHANQREAGFPVAVAGRIHQHPPWWTVPWWQGESLGWPAAVAVVVAAVVGAAAGRRRASFYLAAAVLVPFLWISVLSGKAFPHYDAAWRPALLLLVAVGIVALLRRRSWAAIGGVVLVLAIIGPSLGTLRSVAAIRRSDYAVAAAMLEQRGLAKGPVTVLGHQTVGHAHLPRAVLVSPDEDPDAYVIDILYARRVGLPLMAVRAKLDRPEAGFSRYVVEGMLVYLRDPAPSS